jgi:hypothetical protein
VSLAASATAPTRLATGPDVNSQASDALHAADVSVGDYRGYGLAFTRNKPSLRKTHVGLEIEGVGPGSGASLTENSAMSHWAYAWRDGRLFSGTNPDFDRPKRIGPKPLRRRFGPQPPHENAGLVADNRVAEIITIPNSLIESFFMSPPRLTRRKRIKIFNSATLHS